jgi:hypothetical protein
MQTDDGETFGETHVRAVPPVAADGTTGDEFCVFVFDGFVDVEMTLQDGDEVVAFERLQDLGRVCYGERAVFGWGASRIGAEGGEGGYEGNVNDADDRRGSGSDLEIGGEPAHLFVVDACFPQAVLGWLDRIENDKVITLVIERVVRFADAVFIHFLGVGGIARRHSALFDDAEGIVIPNCMVDGHLERLFGLFVEIKDRVGAIGADRRRVIDVVAAHDGELRLERGDFLEAQVAAVRRIEFRLDMRVGEENKIEGTWSLRVRGQIERGRASEGRRGSCHRGCFQELSSVENHARLPGPKFASDRNLITGSVCTRRVLFCSSANAI